MNGREFLNDQKLDEVSQGDQYFYMHLVYAVFHEVRGRLATYLGWMKFITTERHQIPDATYACLEAWKGIAIEWSQEMNTLAERYHDFSFESPEWPKMIDALTRLIGRAPAFRTELESLEFPTEAETKKMIEHVVKQAKCIDLIHRDILAHDYK
jgi:hypothetical protein